jgi:hypothetical protein
MPVDRFPRDFRIVARGFNSGCLTTVSIPVNRLWRDLRFRLVDFGHLGAVRNWAPREFDFGWPRYRSIPVNRFPQDLRFVVRGFNSDGLTSVPIPVDRLPRDQRFVAHGFNSGCLTSTPIPVDRLWRDLRFGLADFGCLGALRNWAPCKFDFGCPR